MFTRAALQVPVQVDEYFFTVLRYAERRALRAELVKRVKDSSWGLVIALASETRSGTSVVITLANIANAKVDRVSQRASHFRRINCESHRPVRPGLHSFLLPSRTHGVLPDR
ncbi:MAG: hypothetical protein H6822_33785 [Planctomycetaceae bacterium]|nr:hypothetical protein [Planctomycetales bacterium]MCB9927159.1 hypothetical protein [Planctomycetaceae bacterium]